MTSSSARNTMATKIDACLALAFLALCALTSVQGNAVSWNYVLGTKEGPGGWHLEFPNCGGVMQSPININSEQVLYDHNLQYFDMADYSKTSGVKMELHNVKGHTAEVSITGTPLYLTGGSLPNPYQLDQFHFHWGKLNARGSEHAIDGNHYSMEMHLVHNQKHLGNISNAADKPFGLAVLAYLIEASSPGKHNPNFEHLLEYFGNITMPDDKVEIETFKVSSLLPSTSKVNFYRYQGSLTTPPCYQSVIWSIATDTIQISEKQINKFRALYENSNQHLVDDFRPLQLVNQRTITTTSDKFSTGLASRVTQSSAILILAHLLFVCVARFWF